MMLYNVICKGKLSNNCNVIFNRGCVHCLKLSPNLRKQTREVKAALVDKDEKKALMFETKKLESILAMVREPDDKEEDDHEDAP